MDVLRISYEDLGDIDREIFLDIACFFPVGFMQYVKEILDFRGFYPENGLPNLVDKSLITINDGRIKMHDLLRDLGRCIVREKSPKKPRKWSRLWDYEDIYKVMSDNMEAENLEGIVLEGSTAKRFQETTMRVDALSKMRNLKLLILPSYVNFSGSLNYLSNELGYLTWNKYPFKYLPPCFQPHKLVELFLRESSIKQLLEGTQPLPNLRRLNLSNCKSLIEVPNFGEALNLESLELQGCIRLRRFHPSIGFPRNLTLLNLEGCESLVEIPHFVEAINLETLNLQGCTKLRQIHPSIGLLRKLTLLNLEGCRSLINLPPFVEAINLETLNLGGCIQLRQIHPFLGHLSKLTVLNLKDCKSLVSLPNSILGLSSLEYLCLSGCSKLYNIHLLEEPTDARHLKKLCIGEAPSRSQSISSFLKKWLPWPSVGFVKSFEDGHKDSVSCLLPSLPIFSCMRELDLSFCNLLKIPDAFGNFHCLEKLCLRGNNFDTLPSLKELSKLLHLNLQHCKRLKYLPELPSRTDLPSPGYEPPWPIIRVECDELVSGINIFNCPELDERDRCTSMCLSWNMQIVQAHHKYKQHDCQLWPPVLVISSIIPGSEIPRWFDKQHVGMGNVINIDTSHFMQHDNWIGIAYSVIFVVHKEGRMGPPNIEKPFVHRIPLLFRRDLVRDKSDHMWVFYFTRPLFTALCKWNTNKYGDELEYLDELKLECISWNGDQYFDVEVKKYGYRWVYEKDLELSNLTTMHDKNSLTRKRKFLAIEENK